MPPVDLGAACLGVVAVNVSEVASTIPIGTTALEATL